MGERITIPGSVGSLNALAGQLRAVATDLSSVQERVSANGLQGSWSGRAAETFRGSLHELPGELAKIVTAFDDASQAIRLFAARLSVLQEQAAANNAQVERSEEELADARRRESDAQKKVGEARLSHSLATDPVGLATAKSALEVSEGLLRGAVADVEDTGGRIVRLISNGGSISRQYEELVRACCQSLDAARHSSGRPFGAWLGDRLSDVFGSAGHEIGVLWHDGMRDTENLGDDAIHLSHEAWGVVRQDLVDTSTVLSNATLCVCGGILVVAAVLAPIPGLDEADVALVAVDAGILEASGDVLQVESEAILAGDVAAVATGDGEYAKDLPADSIGVIPGDKLFGPALRDTEHEIKSLPALSRAAERFGSNVEDRLGAKAAKQGSDDTVKIGESIAQQKVIDLAHWATHNVKPLISAPLENPEILALKVPPAGAAIP